MCTETEIIEHVHMKFILLSAALALLASTANASLGCTDSSAFNYNSAATVDDGSCEYQGCTDSEASNHNSAATVDDGSCVYADAVLLSKLCETDPSGYVDQVKNKTGCV